MSSARALSAALAALAAFGLATAPADAAKRPRPDLRASAVRAQAFAHPGGPLTVRLTVARRTAAATPATRVRAYLSTDGRRSKDDVALAQGVRVRALRGRTRRAAVVLDAVVPATVAAGARRVIACADDPSRVRERDERDNCAAAPGALTLTAGADPARTSTALIAADRSAGRLSAEQALAYRALAVLGDPALPARYAGDLGPEEDDGVLREVADAWPTLSRATRRTLARALRTPPARDAGARKPSGRRARAAQDEDPNADVCTRDVQATVKWKSVPAAGGKVRIHWDPDHPEWGKDAASIAADISVAYPRFKQIMGVEPISDGSTPCYHGPDGALDIYLDDDLRGADGITVPAEMRKYSSPDCEGMASFIIARPTSHSFTVRFAMAHELFHAFQNAFPVKYGCADATWLSEASANWAAHAVFPTDDSEHFFTFFMDDPDTRPDLRSYHAWPLVLWMEKTFGETSIRTAYQALAKQDSVHAVDTAIGGFRKSYLDFARHAWNTAPMATFRDWDRYTAHPLVKARSDMEPVHLFLLNGQKERSAYPKASLGERGREYHPFTITDDRVRELTYRNPLAGDADFRVGAILTFADGSTRFDDWSGKPTVKFCRDRPDQNVTSLVIVHANASLANTKADGYQGSHVISGEPELKLRDSCGEDFPLHFRILNATLQTSTDGSKSASGDHLCGSIAGLPISGHQTFTAATADDDFGPDNDVTLDDHGRMSGELYVRAPAVFTYDLKGCKVLPDPPQSCTTSFERPAGGDGTWSIGFSLEAPSKDAPEATLNWALADPSIGFFDADDDVCNVQEFWHPLAAEKQRTTVPMELIRGTAPFAVTLEGNDQFTTDSYGKPASLAYSWKSVLTLQRVDAAGNPLE